MKRRGTSELDFSHRQFLTVDKNYAEATAMVDLVYVKDDVTGISRKPLRRKKFAYFFNRKPVKDRKTLERIRKLAIPPAWTDIERNTA